MAENDDRLIELITQVVIERMRQQGGGAPTPSASIQPPAGICTGDYSKFTDRPDLGGAPRDGSAPGAGAAPPPAPPPIAVLTGIINAQQLQEAIAAEPDGVAKLTPDARLTPLANDFAREHPDKIKRVAAAGGATGASGAGRWLWWSQEHSAAAAGTAGQLGETMVASAAPRSEAGLVQIIRDIASGLKAGSVIGGILFVRSAARAAVLANRCASIRAVVGTCEEAVEQGVRDIGANVLIIETPYVNARDLATMVVKMTGSRPSVPAHVERELGELHRGV